MKIDLLFATGNQHKALEVLEMLPSNFALKTLKDLNITEDIPENGTTFKENAHQKAAYLYNKFKYDYIFAEDSGLEVEALNNEPGINTARYAGQQKNNIDNVNLLLTNLKDTLNRKARFYASICLLIKGKAHFFDGAILGHIASQRSGKKGFGYDPIFIPKGYIESFAVLGDDIKNKISHRKLALDKMIDFLIKRAINSATNDPFKRLPKNKLDK